VGRQVGARKVGGSENELSDFDSGAGIVSATARQ